MVAAEAVTLAEAEAARAAVALAVAARVEAAQVEAVVAVESSHQPARPFRNGSCTCT
jgi:hypothetical protein